MSNSQSKDSTSFLHETQHIINRSPIVVVLWRKEKGWPIEFITSNVHKIFGYNASEFISGKISFLDIIPEEDLRILRDDTTHFLSNGIDQFEHRPFRVICKDKSVIWVKEINQVRKDKNGIVTHIEGTIQEVTQQIENEQKLVKEKEISKLREEKYKVFANASFEALFISENGYCVEENEAAVQLFGYSQKEAKGMFATDIFAEEYRDKVLKNIKSGNEKPYDVIALRKDGTTFHAEVQGTSLQLDGVEVRVTAIRDISERKYHEENIMKQKQELRESYRLLKAKTEFLQAINTFSAKIQNIKSIDEVVWEIVENVIDNFHFEHCEIFLIDEDKTSLTQVAKYRIDEDRNRLVPNPLSLKLGEGIVGSAALAQEPELVNDTSLDERYVKDDIFCLSELTVPIVINGQLLGVIDSEHPVKHYFTQDHKEVLTTIANIAATRINNISTLKELEYSELKHRLIFEETHDAIFLMTKDQFVDCNPVTLKMFGCERREQILGESPAKFSPQFQVNGESSEVLARERINKALSGKPQSFEWVHKKLDGSIFTAEVSLNRFEMNDKTFLQAVVRDISKRKALELSLELRKVLYQNLIETTSSVAWEIDCKTSKFTYISPQIVNLLGYELDFWTDLEFWESTIHPHDREYAVEFCNKNAKAGGSHSIEYRATNKNGEIVWIHKGITVVEDDSSKVLRGFFIDITEQKAAQELQQVYTKKLQDKVEELEVARDNYFQLFERTPVSLWEEDFSMVTKLLQKTKKKGDELEKYILENNKFVYQCVDAIRVINVNKISLSLFEVKTKEELLNHLKDTFNDDSLDVFKKELIAISKGATFFNSETEFTTKSGRTISVILNLEILRKGRKGIVSISDITAQKNAEFAMVKAKEKAEENEMYFRTIFETNIDAISISRVSDSTFIEVSPGFCNATGYNKEEVIGKTSLEIGIWFDKLQREKALSELKNNGFLLSFEMSLKNRDGMVRDHLLSAKQFILNEEPHYLIVSRDITEFKESKNELTKKNKELILAKNKAEESDRLKSEFLNNLSHEIRTPLNGIIGFSNFLSENGLTKEQQKHYVSIIQNSGNQLVRIIDEILEISRLETNQVKLSLSQVSLNVMLHELHSIFELLANESGLTLTLTAGLKDKQSIILTDETKLNKIVSNLLQNAIKFTSSGFVSFGYVLVNNQLELFVEDSGMGIKAENLNRIFQRFAQENESIAADYGGLGLGLSIVKEHVDLLGGQIKVTSNKGQGSRFTVTIPYNPVIPTGSEEKNVCDNVNLAKENKLVLVVEDDQVSALYLVTLLKKSGLVTEVIHAKDGQEAIEICESNPKIELVFMDISMPIVDGYEATKQIKKDHPNLVIIAQTAYSTVADLKKIKAAGFDDMTSKPIKKESIVRLLHKYL